MTSISQLAIHHVSSRLIRGLLLALLCVGCSSPPLSVKRATPDATRISLAQNAVSTGELSMATRIALRLHGLTSLHEQDELAAITMLHERVAAGQGGSDEYYALAELSFHYARKLEHDAYWQAKQRDDLRFRGAVRKPPRYTSVDWAIVDQARIHHRAAVLYAFTFLFSSDPEGAIARIDPRSRIAADLYNRSLAAAFTNQFGYLELRGSTYPLPFGELLVEFDETERIWGNRLMMDFLPTDSFEVRGLKNRYRRPGLGTPLAARTVPIDQDDPAGYLVAERAVVSATAVLTLRDMREQLRSDRVTTRLTITPGGDPEPIVIDAVTLPLESQPSAALAASLQESDVWRGKFGTFFGRAVRLNDDNRLFGWEPRLKEQIPVVFIHGTTSTPAVWGNMVNDLQNDPLIRGRYQFLFYAYESGNPILYSSMLLRRALTKAVAALDPTRGDECLRDMVLVGHSQGGLLAKALSIDAGTRFWDNAFDIPIEETHFSPATKSMLKEAAFIEPAAYVNRVIFISTPQRGSFLASSDIVRRLAQWFIRLPGDLTAVAADISGLNDDPNLEYSRLRITTSVDNMSPRNQLIKTLSSIPVDPNIHAHSIISVKGEGPYEDGDDGVVKYRSAHIDEAESEYVVRDSHSTQANPHTVEEVRRILRLHIEQTQCAAVGAPVN
jgi:pimeloyl-ACP methyl ester carboxylesterase